MIDRDDDVNGYGVDYGQFERAHPSDYCVHGQYVGGCGVDFMCGYCEMGYDQWYPTANWVSLMVYAGERAGTYGNISKTFSTQDEAIDHNDEWQNIVDRDWGKEDLIIAILEYPVQSGYWGEREREKEHHVVLRMTGNDGEFGIYYRFEHEYEFIEQQVRDMNERLGEQKFYLEDYIAPWSVYELNGLMYRLTEDMEVPY